MVLPVIICVAPDIAQEKCMQRAAQVSLTRSPGVVVWTTTAVLLKDHGLSLLSGCGGNHRVVK